MKTKKKKVEAPPTIGAQYLLEAVKEPASRDPIELQREMQAQYMENLITCVAAFRQKFDKQDFFVVVLTKRERLMERLFRLYYAARHSCPTPEYDQSVYHFKYKDERLEFLWTIPDKETCYHLRDNALMVHPDERQLLQFVLDFLDDTLLILSKKLNNEIQ